MVCSGTLATASPGFVSLDEAQQSPRPDSSGIDTVRQGREGKGREGKAKMAEESGELDSGGSVDWWMK